MPNLNQGLHPKVINTFLIVALLSSLALLTYAVRWCTAEVFKARALSNLYSNNQLATFDHTEDLLAKARKLNPYDAELLLYQAHFSHYSPKNNRVLTEPLVIKAWPGDVFFRQALSIRPHSGHLWAQYARAQFEHNNDLQRSLVTLEKAMKFAPYQPAVIITAMQIGLPHWSLLSKHQKLRLSEAVGFLIDKNARKVIDISIEYNLTGALRPLLKRPLHIQRLDQAIMKKQKQDRVAQ